MLSPALRRIIRRYQTRFAESFGRQDIGVDPLRAKIRDNVGGSPRREIDAIGHAHSLYRRPRGQIIGEIVDDYFGVLQRSQLRDVLTENCLAISHIPANKPLAARSFRSLWARSNGRERSVCIRRIQSL